MRLASFVAIIPLIAVLTSPAAAEAPRVIVLSPSTHATKTTGQALGDTVNYRVSLTSERLLTFTIDASTGNCGVDLKKKSQRSLLTSIHTFPFTYSDSGAAGEEYTISFYQRRSASLSKLPCNFAFEIG